MPTEGVDSSILQVDSQVNPLVHKGLQKPD